MQQPDGSFVDEALLREDGKPDIAKMDLFVYSGDYFAVGGQAAKAFSIGKEIS